MPVQVERPACLVRCFLADPVGGGGKGREKEAAEGDLLKERCKGDPEDEQDPGGARHAEDAVDGGVLRTWKKVAVEHGEDKAEARRADEGAGVLERAAGPPLQPSEKALVPDQRKDDEAPGEGEEIEESLRAEEVADIRGCIHERLDAEKMAHDSDLGEDRNDGESADSEQAEEGDVAQMRNTLLQRSQVVLEQRPWIS